MRRLQYAIASIALAGVALMGLSGCNYTSHYEKSLNDFGSRKVNDPKMKSLQRYNTLSADPQQHDNKSIAYSAELSKALIDLDGIGAAIVMLSDKNAYVAIALDGAATGTKAHGGRSTHEQSHIGQVDSNIHGQSKQPLGSQNLVSPFNSYYTVKDPKSLSSELKQVVAHKVRQLKPDIRDVHISANMDFINRMNDFAMEAWMGRSLAPLTPQFNALVKSHFGSNVPPATKLK